MIVYSSNVRLVGVGGGIPDAPCDGTACERGVKDAALLRTVFQFFSALNDHL